MSKPRTVDFLSVGDGEILPIVIIICLRSLYERPDEDGIPLSTSNPVFKATSRLVVESVTQGRDLNCGERRIKQGILRATKIICTQPFLDSCGELLSRLTISFLTWSLGCRCSSISGTVVGYFPVL